MLKKNLSLNNFQKLKVYQKKKIFFYFKKLRNLRFIIKRLKFYLKQSLKKNLKIYHNKKFYFNTFYIRLFRKNVKKEFLNFTKINNNNIFIARRKKKKLNIYNCLNKKNKISYDIYNKTLGILFKVGKKCFWNISLSNIFNYLSITLKYSIPVILFKIFIRLYTRVEVKKVKSRKRITFIPVFIYVKRSIFLAIKWIFLSALKNNNVTSFINKLYIEFNQILFLKECSSIKKLEENCLNSFKNRANVHYRW